MVKTMFDIVQKSHAHGKIVLTQRKTCGYHTTAARTELDFRLPPHFHSFFS